MRGAYLVGVAAWAVPGLGHLWLGRRQKGVTFLVALLMMFLLGLWLKGRLFPFQIAEPLVFLMAFADLGMGLPYIIVRGLGLDRGDVVAVTYDYGNAFIIVGGLLNMLVALDAYDIAQGRK
jgi:hypothetical protein